MHILLTLSLFLESGDYTFWCTLHLIEYLRLVKFQNYCHLKKKSKEETPKQNMELWGV